MVICNIVAKNIGSESSTMALLSGMRVIAQKAFGDVDTLKYDAESTKQLKAASKEVKAIKSRYRMPVDLRGVWKSMVQERKRIDHLPDTSTAKARSLRDMAIFLRRHDTVSRSDCETKYDVRLSQYFRVYDERGDLQRQALLSDRLEACLVGDGGYIRQNYKNPKDPRRTGEWSDTVQTRPLRLGILVDKAVPWLYDEDTVAKLCSVRVLRDYVKCMEAMKWMDKIPKDHFWTHCKAGAMGMDGKLPLLQATSIATIVKKQAANGGLNVTKADSPAQAKGAQKREEGQLAGHFLRGHAGSVAYTLALSEGATWDPLLGIDRARHTLESFKKSYARGVVPRLMTAFRSHDNKSQLRFEEAARL